MFGIAFEVMHVVKPATYRRWLRQRRTGQPFKYSGRPRIPMASRNLVLRLAKDNIPWGYRRIVGELKKLGISICSTTIRKILKEEGIHPAPDKGFKKPAVPWTTFVRAHMETMCGCDFLTKRIYTLRGVFTAYMLVWIHFESRKVYRSPATLHPDEEWVMQQARNAGSYPLIHRSLKVESYPLVS